MDNFINKLREKTQSLQDEINQVRVQLQNNNIIELLDKVINGNFLSQKEQNDLKNYITTDEFKNKIPNEFDRILFIFVLLDINMDLDDSQKELLNKVKTIINEKLQNLSDVSELENKINNNNILIEKLQNNEHFENFDELEKAFDILEINTKEKLIIIKDIITKNYSTNIIINNEQASISEQSDEAMQKEIIYNNSEEDLTNVLLKYGYDFNSFRKECKEYLIKYIDINKMDNILNLVKNNSLELTIDKKMKQEQFVRVMRYSSTEVIEEYITICEENNINKQLLLDKNMDVLYTSNKSRHRKKYKTSDNNINNTENDNKQGTLALSNGLFGDFKENISFLKSKGISVFNNKDILISNPDIIKRNYEVFNEIYKCKITDNNLTGLLLGTNIDWIDRLIELSPLGLYYARENLGSRTNFSKKIMYKIKQKEIDGDSLFYRDSNYNVRYKSTDKSYPDLDKLISLIEPVTLELTNDKTQKINSINIEYTANINPNIFDNESIKFLEDNYKKDEYLYDINGVRISRQKVIRIINTFINKGIVITEDEIKYALTYNSIINQEELDTIINYRNNNLKYTGGSSNV